MNFYNSLPFTGKRGCWEGNSSTAHYSKSHPPEKSVFSQWHVIVYFVLLLNYTLPILPLNVNSPVCMLMKT